MTDVATQDQDALTKLQQVRQDVKATLDAHAQAVSSANGQVSQLQAQIASLQATATSEQAAADEHKRILDEIDDVLAKLAAELPALSPPPAPAEQPAA